MHASNTTTQLSPTGFSELLAYYASLPESTNSTTTCADIREALLKSHGFTNAKSDGIIKRAHAKGMLISPQRGVYTLNPDFFTAPDVISEINRIIRNTIKHIEKDTAKRIDTLSETEFDNVKEILSTLNAAIAI